MGSNKWNVIVFDNGKLDIVLFVVLEVAYAHLTCSLCSHSRLTVRFQFLSALLIHVPEGINFSGKTLQEALVSIFILIGHPDISIAVKIFLLGRLFLFTVLMISD